MLHGAVEREAPASSRCGMVRREEERSYGDDGRGHGEPSKRPQVPAQQWWRLASPTGADSNRLIAWLEGVDHLRRTLATDGGMLRERLDARSRTRESLSASSTLLLRSE